MNLKWQHISVYAFDFVHSCARVFDSYILYYNKFDLLLQLLLESSVTLYSSRFLQVFFYFTQVVLKRLTSTSTQEQNKSSSVTPALSSLI